MKTYYKSQVIPGNNGTIVYWYEDEHGKSHDTSREAIPKDTKILDADAMLRGERNDPQNTQ